MKLFYFRGMNGVENFGDELNPWMWPQLLPAAFEEDDGTQFVGIGTVLNGHLPAASRTVVFGAGVGYGPPRRDVNWTIYCVRGPLSARALGLSVDAAVTDPAALISRLPAQPTTSGARWTHAFMPHWRSEPDAWRQVCLEAGIGFIDPRWRPDDVLDALQRTDVLIAEALHGAIVADALRIPWVPVRTREGINSFKWEDWCGSLTLAYRPHHLPTMWSAPADAGLLRRARRPVKVTIVSRALASLVRRAHPTLSREDVLEERLRELERRLEQLRLREIPAATRTRRGNAV